MEDIAAMYQSPVPLIVIRSAAPSLVEVNGQLLGECQAGSHIAMPAGDSGDYFISVAPLSFGCGAWRYPVTRKLSLRGGEALPVQGSGVSLCRWPGGVYELCFCPQEESPAPGADFPKELDQLGFTQGKSRKTLTLYRENGLKLLSEEEGRQPSCISLGGGEYGSLALYGVAGRQLIAVTTFFEGRQRLLMLDGEMNALLELSGQSILLEEGFVSLIEPLGTLLGHQRRTRYVYQGGGFSQLSAETGFFTNEYAFPEDSASLAAAFCEAVQSRLDDEAKSYLCPQLRNEFSIDEIRAFLGSFCCCRPPLSDRSGRLMGLIQTAEDGAACARLFEFSFEGGLIADIAEA